MRQKDSTPQRLIEVSTWTGYAMNGRFVFEAYDIGEVSEIFRCNRCREFEEEHYKSTRTREVTAK